MDNKKFEITRNVGILGILGNVFLLIIKSSIGFYFKSQSMISDAFNSASDIFASLMTFFGNKISSIPKDNNHNFGHGKAEYIFSMFISISMILIASKLFFDSISILILGSNLTFSWFLVFTCIITIIIKFLLYLYTKKAYQQYNNILLKSNMKDHRNDCIATTCTLISILLSFFGIYWLDSLVGLGISVWIGYTGYLLLMESSNILMDVSIDESTKEKIINIIKQHSEIKSIQSIYSSSIGSQYVIFITIVIDGNLSTFDSHLVATNIENEVSILSNIYNVIVHVEPE